MIIIRKQRVITEDSDIEQDGIRPSTNSLRKIPQFRDDSGTEVDYIRHESSYKGMRRVVLDNDDEDA